MSSMKGLSLSWFLDNHLTIVSTAYRVPDVVRKQLGTLELEVKQKVLLALRRTVQTAPNRSIYERT